MLFHLAFFSILWLVPAVLSGHARHPSRFVKRVSGSGIVENSHTWSGVALDKENGTFTFVSTTFKVPVVSGSRDQGFTMWIGIDGHSEHCLALFQCGVDAEIGAPGTYLGWCGWYNEDVFGFPELAISAGDIIKVTLDAPSQTSGIGKIENVSTGQKATTTLPHSNMEFPFKTLCHRSAEWIFEDDLDIGNNHDENYSGQLGTFSNVTFMDIVATGPSGNHTLEGYTVVDLIKNQRVTSVDVGESTVTVKHL